MSLSPSQRDTHKPSKSAKAEPLTLSQALLITAGMAGLVGLCGGAILRFSVANSSNARFLSPLQTFPALSDWTPELSQETADSRDLTGGASESEADESRGGYAEDFQTESTILTFEPAEPVDDSASKPISESLDTSVDADSEPTDIRTFDMFADRGQGRRRTAAPLDLLEKGPDLRGIRQTAPDPSGQRSSERGVPYDDNTQGDIFDDSERYDETYRDDGYGDAGYYEGVGAASPTENRYDGGNYYPPTDESLDGNNAYYD